MAAMKKVYVNLMIINQYCLCIIGYTLKFVYFLYSKIEKKDWSSRHSFNKSVSELMRIQNWFWPFLINKSEKLYEVLNE